LTTARSPDFDFLLRTAISFFGVSAVLLLSRFATVPFVPFVAVEPFDFVDLTSSVSGATSGGRNVCSLNALRCLLAFGSEIELSDDRGLGLLLLVRVAAAAGAALIEGENMVKGRRITQC
jgi:hypothetical protein